MQRTTTHIRAISVLQSRMSTSVTLLISALSHLTSHFWSLCPGRSQISLYCMSPVHPGQTLPRLTLCYLPAKAVFVVIIIVVIAVVAFLLLHHYFIHEAGRAPLLFLLLRCRGAPHLHNGRRKTALCLLRLSVQSLVLLGVGCAVTRQLRLCHHSAGQCV